MLKFYSTDIPDVELYESRLRAPGYIYLNKEKASKLLVYQDVCRVSCYNLAKIVMKANSSNRYRELSDDMVCDYLLEVERCPEYKILSNKNKRGYSIESKSVLMPLLQNGYAREFLEPFIEFKSLKKQCSTIRNMIAGLVSDDTVNEEGQAIERLAYKVNVQTNLRFNYNNFDIVTIPHIYNSCVSVPKGKILVWADFDQSDLRIAYNLFLRDKNNAKIMDACDDKYEGMARLVAAVNNEPFDLDKFKKERDLYKVHVLKTIYGGQPAGTEEERQFIKKLQKFLNTCPRYVEYKKRLDDKCALGLPLQINSYFGHTEIYNIGYNKSSAVNFGLNSPNQTGTSEIMVLTVNTILNKFYELGYTQDQVDIYYVRHDECLFMIDEEVMRDAWIFKECSEILVDNWTPLTLSFNFGYNYKEPVESLKLLAENNWLINKDKITQIPLDTSEVYEYIPVTDTLNLEIGTYSVEGNTIICIYNTKANTCKYYELGSENYADIMSAVRSILSKQAEVLSEKYGGALIYNQLTDGEDFVDSFYMKYIRDLSSFSKSSILANLFFAKRYPNKFQAETISVLLNNNSRWIKTIKDNKIVD